MLMKNESVKEEKLVLQEQGNNFRNKVLETKKGVEAVLKVDKLGWGIRVRVKLWAAWVVGR